MYVKKHINEKTNLTYLGRTTTSTRGYVDLTISLLFFNYFYIKKKKPQTSLEEKMQRTMSLEEGRAAEVIHPHQMSMREESEKDKTNHRKGEKLATTKKRTKIEN